MFVVIFERRMGLVLFIFGTVIRCHVLLKCKIVFGSMPNLSNYGNIVLKFYVFCYDIPEKKGLILFTLGI